MNPHNKAGFSFVSFFLVLVTLACNLTSAVPSGGAAPTTSSGGVTPGSKGSVPSTPTAAFLQPEPAALEQVSDQTTIPAGKSAAIAATCPGGTQALGGGFASAPGIRITRTMPDPSGWLVSALNTSASELPLTVYANCLRGDTGSVRVVSADVLVSGGPMARCEKGEIVTGGGYSFDTDSLDVYISTPIGDSVDPSNAWSVMAHNQGADQTIRVYALCLSNSTLTSTLVRDQTNYLQGTDSVTVTLTCPSGAFMSAGGYEGTGAYISRVNPADAGQWEVQVQGKIYFDGSLDHAVCLNLP
jgi:hypothetical protein